MLTWNANIRCAARSLVALLGDTRLQLRKLVINPNFLYGELGELHHALSWGRWAAIAKGLHQRLGNQSVCWALFEDHDNLSRVVRMAADPKKARDPQRPPKLQQFRLLQRASVRRGAKMDSPFLCTLGVGELITPRDRRTVHVQDETPKEGVSMSHHAEVRPPPRAVERVRFNFNCDGTDPHYLVELDEMLP
eukprot:SAG11_NODE_10040_length_861_cov_1.262467_1_plen_191_part_01